MTLLRIDHLGIDIESDKGRHRIIHDVTLSLGSGEAVGLVGESGAGKSMTSRAVIGLLPSRAHLSGDIVFEGRSVPAMDREGLRQFRAHEVAMIFQDPRAHINPVRTIGDFLVEALVERGERKSDALVAVSRLMEMVGIREVGQRLVQFPHELSGGMLQRVMIAGALAVEPRLLLADEPTTALDVTTQAEVMAHLDRLRRERDLAMLFVTHDLELAAAVCDRIAVIYAGFLVEDLPARTIHDLVLHPYTAGLLASRPSASSRVTRLVAIPGRPQSAYEVGEGCPFVSRCSYAVEHCREERPDLREIDGVRVACHRAEELRGHLFDKQGESLGA